MVQVQCISVVVDELHWRRYCTNRRMECQIQGVVLTANAYRLFLLPDEYVVDHCTATEYNAKPDKDAGDDRRC